MREVRGQRDYPADTGKAAGSAGLATLPKLSRAMGALGKRFD